MHILRGPPDGAWKIVREIWKTISAPEAAQQRDPLNLTRLIRAKPAGPSCSAIWRMAMTRLYWLSTTRES
ncbi:MAG: hypothetical protein ABSA41_09130 [Terriglobia bacterium]|jgi:hypothetical protein